MEEEKKNRKKKTWMTATEWSTNEGGFLAFNASFNPSRSRPHLSAALPEKSSKGLLF